MRVPGDRTERLCCAARDSGVGDVPDGPAEQALPQREPGSSEATAAPVDPAADQAMLRKILDRLHRI